jgi:type VI secretion system protein ImpC
MEFSFGNVKLGTRAGEAPIATPSEETPFRIAIMGDFSGKGSHPGEPAKLSTVRPIAVDRDNIESLLGKLNTELRLPSDAGDIVLRFKELDDFRPERLFAQVSAFDKLRSTRKKLSKPETFAQAAAELREWTKPAVPPVPAPQAAPPAPGVPAADLLEAVLGETAARRAEEQSGPPGGPDLTAFLRQAVAGHVVREDPRQAELIEVVDRATSNLMRAILHHPQFQAMESLWRGLYFLARRLDTDTQLKLFLIDVSRAELAADLMGAEDLSKTGAYRLIVEQTVGTPGAPPWAVLVGNYTFGPTVPDVELLARLSMLVAKAGAPFVAAASPATVGARSFATADPEDWQPLADEAAQAWEMLRSLPQASYLGLALPRFLLRLPYGKNTDPVESFTFEELPEGSAHEGYLWGNPAIAVALLLGEAFSRRGWSMRPGMVQDIENLPMHVYEADGDQEMKPCAEALLTRRAIDRIAERGLMPLLSVQGRDSAQLGTFRSLAQGGKLAGRWGG